MPQSTDYILASLGSNKAEDTGLKVNHANSNPPSALKPPLKAQDMPELLANCLLKPDDLASTPMD